MKPKKLTAVQRAAEKYRASFTCKDPRHTAFSVEDFLAGRAWALRRVLKAFPHDRMLSSTEVRDLLRKALR